MEQETQDTHTNGNDKPGIPGFVRELAMTGLATFFMTEDSVRKYLKELRLPKEMAAILLETITKRKDDFYGLVAKEVGKVFSRADIAKEVEKFLKTHNVHINATVSFDAKSSADKKRKRTV